MGDSAVTEKSDDIIDRVKKMHQMHKYASHHEHMQYLRSIEKESGLDSISIIQHLTAKGVCPSVVELIHKMWYEYDYRERRLKQNRDEFQDHVRSVVLNTIEIKNR